MKRLFTHRKRLRCALLLCLWVTGAGVHAQDPLYLDGPDPITVSAGQTIQWYGPVTLGPNCQIYIEDGGRILFYGSSLTIAPGAKIYGAAAGFVNPTQGIGSGAISFVQPNPYNNTTVLQTLNGGNSGNPANANQNTIPSIEINNSKGVKLLNSFARIGSNINFVNGHLYTDVQDAVLSSTATITGADASRYVVTAASGHLVKEAYTNTFTFPVGKADNDYTPAAVTPAALNTIHVNVIDYASDGLAAQSLLNGMNRTWNIYGNTNTAAQIGLQHNSITNGTGWRNTANFVTRYGTAPNNTGDITGGASSPWQTNTPSASSTVNGTGTESNGRFYSNLAIASAANEAWYTKFSASSTVVVSAKVLLQGAVSGSIMTTILNTSNLIPTAQPYRGAPFNYAGNETVAAVPAGITDWVLVELRDAVTPTTIVATRAAFVKSDGTIVDTDGISPVSFSTVTPGSYHIAIRHRNHLAIRSATAQTLNSTATLYDFTTSQTQAYQNPANTVNTAMKDLGNGKFAMWGGDGNSNGKVSYAGLNNDETYLSSTTLNNVLTTVLSPVYNNADFNMNGKVSYGGIGNDETFLSSTVLANVLSTVLSQHL